VAVDGALGDEQPRTDLLVGQAVGDQPRDVGLALPERSRADLAVCGRAGRGRPERAAADFPASASAGARNPRMK